MITINFYIVILVLQSLNQRPGQPMNIPGMQNKMPGMGMMPSQTGGPINHMGPIQTMQNNPMLTQMNQMGQGNIPPQMNQMVPGQMGQLSAGQMQQNMQVCSIYLLLNNYYKSYINKLHKKDKIRKKDETVFYVYFYHSPRCKINYLVK